jgi:hypothetical protein
MKNAKRMKIESYKPFIILLGAIYLSIIYKKAMEIRQKKKSEVENSGK